MTQLLFNDDAYLQRCDAVVTAVGADGIELDATVFYPEGGGQPGDCGVLRWSGGDTAIVGAVKKPGGGVLHVPAEDAATPPPGTPVSAEIDWARRYCHMKMHTCMHLLCAVIDAPVTGGSIGAERARLDFDLPEPIDKQAVSDALNRLIDADYAVATRWISDAELDAQPELVKTMSVQPPRGGGRVRLLEVGDVDLQPCGGTHVARTGEIGAVTVAKVEKKSRLNRRVIVTFADR